MGFQKKSEKSAMCTVPKPHPPLLEGHKGHNFFWGTLYVFLLPTKNCKMTRIDHPKIELLSKYTEHV